MATDERISVLTQLLTPATGDLFAVVDVSEADINKRTKMITVGTLDGRYQALDAGLTDIAALAVTDGNFIVGDGANWVTESGATARASLGLTIGTNVQAYDPFLTSIATLGTAADKLIYTTGVDTAAETAITAYARSILDDANEATFKEVEQIVADELDPDSDIHASAQYRKEVGGVLTRRALAAASARRAEGNAR